MLNNRNQGDCPTSSTVPRGRTGVAARPRIVVLTFGMALSVLAGASPSSAQGGRLFYPDDPLWVDDDTLDMEPPADFAFGQWYDFLQNTLGDPGEGSDIAALNVNTVGEVPDSAWFTNRLGLRPMSVAEVARGPNVASGPAPGTWTVVGKPGSGVTPKFSIRDERGDKYLVKFDPENLPGTGSSAEVISSKFFHALGYNVPANHAVQLDLSRLQIDPEAEFEYRGRTRPITMDDIHHWLRGVARNPDGTYRAVASRWIDGTYLGGFRYYGSRPDDPNDIYPHEHRRELRALRVFSAWLNHDDSRAINTADFYIEENGRRFIRHYLIDFGSTMGSASVHLQPLRGGYEYFIEPGKVALSLITLGLWERDYAKVDYPDYPSVGRFEADYFEPWKWKPDYPNPAFDRMDGADAFWGARLLSFVTDEMIRAVVAEAPMPSVEAEYMVETLIRRRDKVVRYWISRTNPLDGFAVETRSRGHLLTFDNAAARVRAVAEAGAYELVWTQLDNISGETTPVGGPSNMETTGVTVPDAAWGPLDDTECRYAVALIRSLHPDFPEWREPIRVTLREHRGTVEVVGVHRPGLELDYKPVD